MFTLTKKAKKLLLLLTTERFALTQALKELDKCDSLEVIGLQEQTVYGVVFQGTEDDPLKQRVGQTSTYPHTHRVPLLESGNPSLVTMVKIVLYEKLDDVEKELKELKIQ